jgi:hypothetical protein
MYLIKINGKSYRVAQTWEELTGKQLLSIAPIVFCMPQTPVNQWKVLRALLPVSTALLRRLTDGQIYDLLQTVDWIWRQPMDHCPVKSFTCAGIVYHLPDNEFNHVIGIEYALADMYLKKFMENPADSSALDGMISILCRPERNKHVIDPDWNGDIRERFNSGNCAGRIGDLKFLPVATKVIILQFFVSRQRFIVARYAPLFKDPDPGGETTDGSQPKAGGPLSKPRFNAGWLGMLFDLSEAGVFGDFDRTSHTGFHTIMLYLLKKHFDVQALKENQSA